MLVAIVAIVACASFSVPALASDLPRGATTAEVLSYLAENDPFHGMRFPEARSSRDVRLVTGAILRASCLDNVPRWMPSLNARSIVEMMNRSLLETAASVAHCYQSIGFPSLAQLPGVLRRLDFSCEQEEVASGADASAVSFRVSPLQVWTAIRSETFLVKLHGMFFLGGAPISTLLHEALHFLDTYQNDWHNLALFMGSHRTMPCEDPHFFMRDIVYLVSLACTPRNLWTQTLTYEQKIGGVWSCTDEQTRNLCFDTMTRAPDAILANASRQRFTQALAEVLYQPLSADQANLVCDRFMSGREVLLRIQANGSALTRDFARITQDRDLWPAALRDMLLRIEVLVGSNLIPSARRRNPAEHELEIREIQRRLLTLGAHDCSAARAFEQTRDYQFWTPQPETITDAQRSACHAAIPPLVELLRQTLTLLAPYWNHPISELSLMNPYEFTLN